jgi:hypothetical protein
MPAPVDVCALRRLASTCLRPAIQPHESEMESCKCLAESGLDFRSNTG